jgi:hypothetical protein
VRAGRRDEHRQGAIRHAHAAISLKVSWEPRGPRRK